ncbi:MAG: hypothetical protein IPK74_21060 [Deltaproteobacteria bacterium]|nr:hypothetical protein [Deltaproteobacteria bacterium]
MFTRLPCSLSVLIAAILLGCGELIAATPDGGESTPTSAADSTFGSGSSLSSADASSRGPDAGDATSAFTTTTTASATTDTSTASASDTTDAGPATDATATTVVSTSTGSTGTTSGTTGGPPPDPVCGNLWLEDGEDCDDGNADEYDGCTSSCTLSLRSLSLGIDYTCSTNAGALRCWGANSAFQLGLGLSDPIGDDELPSDVPELDVGGTVAQIETGTLMACALLVGGDVRCWGDAVSIVLGGDGTATAAESAVLDLGGRAVQIAVGQWHGCALLEGGAVRCFGSNGVGQLGYPGVFDVGNVDAAGAGGDVSLGGLARRLDLGSDGSAVVLDDGTVRVWGHDDGAALGDDETPDALPAIDAGGTAIEVRTWPNNGCVVLDDGGAKCWGDAYRSGLAVAVARATLGAQPSIEVGVAVTGIGVGDWSNCALRQDGGVVCWGRAENLDQAPLGYGIGDVTLESPPMAGDLGVVPLGGDAVSLRVGPSHTCVILDSLAIRCWGLGGDGRLGYGNTDDVGRDDTPADVGDVSVW